MEVYVASPLGFTVPTRAWYVDTLLPLLHGAGHDVLDPWAASAGHIADAAGDRDAIAAANRSAGARNEELIRSCRRQRRLGRQPAGRALRQRPGGDRPQDGAGPAAMIPGHGGRHWWHERRKR